MSGRGRNLLGRGCFGRFVKARANFSAPSTASVPELQRKQASREGPSFLTRASGEEAGEDGAVHLNHVREVEIQIHPEWLFVPWDGCGQY